MERSWQLALNNKIREEMSARCNLLASVVGAPAWVFGVKKGKIKMVPKPPPQYNIGFREPTQTEITNLTGGQSYWNCTVTAFNKGYPPQSAQGEHKEYYDKDDEQGKQRARRDGAKKAQVIARNKLENQFGTR